MKICFYKISLNGHVLNYTFTRKGGEKWIRKWMKENVNKTYSNGSIIYNGSDVVTMEECFLNDEQKTPRCLYSYSLDMYKFSADIL